MARIITFHNPSPEDLKENYLKRGWEYFLSLDRFLRTAVLFFLLLLITTPFIVTNYQIFTPHAAVQQICANNVSVVQSAKGSLEDDKITSVSTSTSLSRSGDGFYLAAVSTKPDVMPTKVSGLGLTWQLVRSQCSGRNQTQISLYQASGTPSSESRVTAHFNSFRGGAAIDVIEYSGVDTVTPLGTVVSANTNGINGTCTGGQDTANYSYSINTTLANSVVFSATAQRNRTHTSGKGFTERANFRVGTDGESAGIAAEDATVALPNVLVINGSFSDPADWASVAVEVRKTVCIVPTPTPTPSLPPTPIPTSVTTPTPSPIASATPAPITTPASGIWLSKQDIAALPESGDAWNRLKMAADSNPGAAQVSNQDSNHDTFTLAEALVYARTGDSTYRSKAAAQIMSAINTEAGGRVLAEARNIPPYVIAADLIDLKSYNQAQDQTFRAWLTKVRTEQMTECDNLILCDEKRPNNWGMHSGAARAVIDVYLGDKIDLARTAQVFKGWLGDRASYAGFSYGDLSWQCNSSLPIGINPKGCTRNGNNLDGILPDDQRRSSSYTWPAPHENYVYEALQGAIVEAVILNRQGYDTFSWSDQALLRAYNWLYYVNAFPATGDDTWQTYLVNHYYGTSFPTIPAVSPGKNMGWTDWTHPH